MPHKIIRVCKGGLFISFSNADGKRWIMPLQKMRTAMSLYQPSGMKGRWVKRLLPYVYRVPFVGKIIHSELINIELEESVREQIAQTLGVENFDFAIFEGTPSVHKKTTLQIWHDSKILAYCKLSDNEEIGRLFERESIHLNSLHGAGIKQIPQSLFYGKVIDNHIFIQSTIKTGKSRTIHQWTQRHWEFLTLLHENTKVKCRFEDSDMAKSINSLEGHLKDLPQQDSETISRAIKIVRTNYGESEVDFSAFHGDFTPWNMFSESEKLFVFDWEYSLSTCPPYMDMFHYFTQTSIFEKYLNEQGIYKSYKAQLCRYFENPDIEYMCYLLLIIELYLSRDSGILSKELCLKVEQRIRLIAVLISNR